MGKRWRRREAASRDVANPWLPLGAEGGLSDVGGQGLPLLREGTKLGILTALKRA